MSERSFTDDDEPKMPPVSQREHLEREAAALGITDVPADKVPEPRTDKYVAQVWAGLIIDEPVLKAERERRRHAAARLAERAEERMSGAAPRSSRRR